MSQLSSSARRILDHLHLQVRTSQGRRTADTGSTGQPCTDAPATTGRRPRRSEHRSHQLLVGFSGSVPGSTVVVVGATPFPVPADTSLPDRRTRQHLVAPGSPRPRSSRGGEERPWIAEQCGGSNRIVATPSSRGSDRDSRRRRRGNSRCGPGQGPRGECPRPQQSTTTTASAVRSAPVPRPRFRPFFAGITFFLGRGPAAATTPARRSATFKAYGGDIDQHDDPGGPARPRGPRRQQCGFFFFFFWWTGRAVRATDRPLQARARIDDMVAAGLLAALTEHAGGLARPGGGRPRRWFPAPPRRPASPVAWNYCWVPNDPSEGISVFPPAPAADLHDRTSRQDQRRRSPTNEPGS